MRIAIVTNFIYPEGLGGTELYCFQLIQALVSTGNDVFWLIPNFGSSNTVSEAHISGAKVIRFATKDAEGKDGLAVLERSFASAIRNYNIETAHFNEFGGEDGINPTLLRIAREAGAKTIVTLHLANYICKSSTMHFAGKQPCNGKVITARCSSCFALSGLTGSSTFNYMTATVAAGILSLKAVRSLPGIKTIVAAVEMKRTFIGELANHADRIVSLTKWFRTVLIENGISADKITYIPQVSPDPQSSANISISDSRKGYVFIGRVNKEKGVDLLMEIAPKLKRAYPELVVDLYGPYTPTKVLPHTIIDDLNGYDNIRYKGVLELDEVLPVMNQYKAVILPSRVAEMAPLIIMEANRLKVPVIVSDVPGSSELVKASGGGLVFKYGSAKHLFKRISEIEQATVSFQYREPEINGFRSLSEKYVAVYKKA